MSEATIIEFAQDQRPSDISAEEWQARCELAAAYRLCALYGWTDLNNTHLSLRVPGTRDHFLLNPFGMFFEEITASSLIKVDGDGAGVETYFIATMKFTDNPTALFHMGGRYVDRLEREGGRWKVKTRLCIREWSSEIPMPVDWQADAGFIETRRGPSDVSWEALGLTHSGVPPHA